MSAQLAASNVLLGPYRTVDQLVRDPASPLGVSTIVGQVAHPSVGPYPAPRTVLVGEHALLAPLRPPPLLGAPVVAPSPLQAIALADLCRRFLPERRVSAFSSRALTPAFDEGPLRLRGRIGSDPNAVELVAFDAHGEATLRAEAHLEG